MKIREREGGKNRRPKKEIILLENEMKNIGFKGGKLRLLNGSEN